MKRQGMLAVVSGFSGAGKGTVMKALLEKYDNYALSISATTRAPRPGEQDGREYFFMTDGQFEELIQNDRLIEHARRVVQPGGVVLFETPNPENLVVGACNFYVDPTHRNPMPPALMAF